MARFAELHVSTSVSTNMKNKILLSITQFYLESRDFNGMPFQSLVHNNNNDFEGVRNSLRVLLEEKQVEIVYGDYHPNPHIKAFSGTSNEEQIEKLSNNSLLNQSCIYPSGNHLKEIVSQNNYIGKPYKLELALGAGQLDYRSFDVSVLEYYRNDPRYYYDNDDIRGWISVHDEFYESGEMASSDQTFLETFGFCYDDDFNRAVAVFLRYLANLSSEHQQLWKSKELRGNYKLHPDYYRNSILGDWGTKISIFDAFIQEIEVVNSMCALIDKPTLFHKSFSNGRLREFGFILRPTLAEFNSFIHLLDKMLSDNINKEFFRGDVPLEIEKERSDGKIEVRQKGTLQLLQDWITKYFRPSDPKPLEEMFESLKKIRKLRQKPAHAVKENEFNQKYFKEQRTLIIKSYQAIRTLRLILANHPAVKSHPPEIGEHLKEGKIWDI